MRAWFENVAGPQYATGVMWTIAALILLLVLLVLARIIRNLTAGTFIAGGRNRRTRLAVMDAAAVDNQRRLVLVRRDDVEHLILIGGPTDVVVEQNIGLAGPGQRNQGRAEEPVVAAPPIQTAPQKHERPPAPERSAEPARVEKPEPVVPVSPAPQPPSHVPERSAFTNVTPATPERNAHRPENPPSPVAPPPRQEAQLNAAAEKQVEADEEFHPASLVQPASQEEPATPQIPANDIDRALAREIETAAVTKPAPDAPERPNSLEDEMSRLLGELSRERG